MGGSTVYEALNKNWKSAAKIILGEEIGELRDYEGWLWDHMEQINARKSKFSGKDVYFAIPFYCENAGFASMDEIDFGKKFEPLDINEVKDIDSVIGALHERFYYAGNIKLANCRNVDRSSNIQNSAFVYNSSFIYDSEFAAYSQYVRWAKNIFSVVNDVESTFVIRGLEIFRDTRCLDVWKCYNCSDCYFSFGVEASRHALFSFNLKNRNYIIGNLELPKDKYLSIRDGLIRDLREELVKNRRLPSLMEMLGGNKKIPKIPEAARFEYESDVQDKNPAEAAFKSTSKVVLGKELSDLDHYEKWLSRHIPEVKKVKSVVSGKTVLWGVFPPHHLFLEEKMVKNCERGPLGENLRLDIRDLESLDSIKKNLWKIGFISPEGFIGENRNLIGVPLANQSVDCYKGPLFAYNDRCAFCFWPRNSRFMFGCALALSSEMCINAHYSLNVVRSFEVDCCSGCSDIYFSHNCENIRNGMFCFNVKNKSNAIGNYEIEAGKYSKIRSALLEQISGEIEKTKGLKWDIYNIGCGAGGTRVKK